MAGARAREGIMVNDDEVPDDEVVPNGWRVNSWSRTRDGFDLTCYRHEPPGEADALPESVREELMLMFEQRRFSWSAKGSGISLDGAAPTLAAAAAAAEEAVDDLVREEEAT